MKLSKSFAAFAFSKNNKEGEDISSSLVKGDEKKNDNKEVGADISISLEEGEEKKNDGKEAGADISISLEEGDEKKNDNKEAGADNSISLVEGDESYNKVGGDPYNMGIPKALEIEDDDEEDARDDISAASTLTYTVVTKGSLASSAVPHEDYDQRDGCVGGVGRCGEDVLEAVFEPDLDAEPTTYYDLLGVALTARLDDIKRAYESRPRSVKSIQKAAAGMGTCTARTTRGGSSKPPKDNQADIKRAYESRPRSVKSIQQAAAGMGTCTARTTRGGSSKPPKDNQANNSNMAEFKAVYKCLVDPYSKDVYDSLMRLGIRDKPISTGADDDDSRADKRQRDRHLKSMKSLSTSKVLSLLVPTTTAKGKATAEDVADTKAATTTKKHSLRQNKQTTSTTKKHSLRQKKQTTSTTKKHSLRQKKQEGVGRTIQAQPPSSAVVGDYYNYISNYISLQSEAISTPSTDKEQQQDRKDIIDILAAQVILKRMYDLLEQSSEKDNNSQHFKRDIVTAYHKGAVLALIQQMKRFQYDEPIQLMCICICISMTAPSNNNCSCTAATAGTIIRQGALRLCLKAMERFNNSKSLVLPSACCRLLGNMMENKELVKQVIDIGGLNAILSVMTGHPHHVWIQEEGCYALHRFLENSDDDDKIVKIIAVLADAIADDEDNSPVVIRSCNLLRHLAEKNDAYRKMIVDSKGFLAVSSISICHYDKDVKDAASKALKVLWPAGAAAAEKAVVASAE